jgi:mRNA-degrading endonuclease RelE of RelBE toxin-antitoxin system
MPEKSWSVEISRSSLKALGKLERSIRTRILDRLEELGEAENPSRHKDIRPLEGKLRGFHRFRVGEYRLIIEFDTKNKRIGVHAVISRGKAY